MYRYYDKFLLIILTIFWTNCMTVKPIKEKSIVYRNALHTELLNFSISSKDWVDLDSTQLYELRYLSTNICNIEKSKKEGEPDFPIFTYTYNNKRYLKFNCLWNFRKELIEINFQKKDFPGKEFKIYWYSNFPTTIQYYIPNENLLVKRSWEWSIMHGKWESTRVFIGFEDIEKGRKFEYFFSRFTGSLRSKREWKLNEKWEWELDGWQYNHDDTINEEHCHEFRSGKIVNSDLDQCRIRFPSPIPEPNDVNF
ncbi:MAG: hypothetical protein JJT78_03400 [Leptospira sp.]|nr:hypothetical protein [Leptospira sp.]